MDLKATRVDKNDQFLVEMIKTDNPDGVHPEREVEGRLGSEHENLQAFALLTPDERPVSVVYSYLATVEEKNPQDMLTQVGICDILSAKVQRLKATPNLALCYSITNNPHVKIPGVSPAPLLIAFAKASLELVAENKSKKHGVSEEFDRAAQGKIMISSISPNWTFADWLRDKHLFGDFIAGTQEAKLALNIRHLADGVKDFRNGQKSALSHAARLHLSNGAVFAGMDISQFNANLPFPQGQDLKRSHRDVREGMGTKNYFWYNEQASENTERYKRGELPVYADIQGFFL